MLEIIIDNRNGNLWDVSGIASDASYKTSRVGKASTFEFTLITGGIYESSKFKCGNGDVIRVHKDGIPLFYGYVFNLESGRDEAVKITAYDQIRYLMGNDTYVLKNVKVGDIIKRIADDLGLKTGKLADTGYSIPSIVEDGVKLLDIICNAIDKTLMGDKGIFIFYDDFGLLTLRNMVDWKLGFSLGDASLVYDYKQKRSIDSETYNRVKLVQDNKNTNKRDVYIAQDGGTIAQWGRLQLYQKVDDNMNAAQIKMRMNNLLELHNRESRSFSLEALGDVRVRAGCSVSINIAEIDASSYYLVEECSHKFDGTDHTMSLELKVYG